MKIKCIFLTLVVLGILATFGGLSSCGGDDDDLGDIAASLQDRLTNALKFYKGAVVDGGPPPYFEGDEYPQIEFVEPPEVEIVFGEDFELKVKTGYEFPEEIDGAMIWVKDSGLHIDVDEPVDSQSLLMILKGRLEDQADFHGQSFDLYVSLYKGSETGLHETWRIIVPE